MSDKPIDQMTNDDLAELTLDQFFIKMRAHNPGEYEFKRCEAELNRRQARAQSDALDAQKTAADATVETAIVTRQMVRWVRVSSLATAASVVITAVALFLTYH